MKNIQLNKHKNNSKNQRLRSKRLAHYKHLRNTTKTIKLQSQKKAAKNQTKQSQKSKTQTKHKVTRPKGSTKSKTNQLQEKKIKKHEIQEQQQELKTSILLLNKYRYETHMDKYRNLTSIGIPTIKLDQNILKNYINQQKEINENIVQKLIGIIGEGFIELPNESIINLEQKYLIIQKRVNQLLSNCSVNLGWNSDRWIRLIGKTVHPIQYPNMDGVEINQSLSTKERYRLMFQTVNLFHLQNTIGDDNQHNFSKNLPLQTVNDIDLSELINQNDLGNVRILRKYLSGILQVLKKISKFDPLEDEPQNMKELYKQQNLLQDLCVEYYISKMKPLKLKFFRPKIQSIDDFQVQIEDEQKESSNQKELSNQKESSNQKILKVKKSINLNGKPRTLLEFFKPVRKNVSLNQNNDAQHSPLPKNIIQKQDSPNYFEILEGYIKDFYIESNKSLKASDEGK